MGLPAGTEGAADEPLAVTLETALRPLPTGSATAIFCAGTCHHADGEVTALELEAGGERRAVEAFGMPRPGMPVYRSGFWTTFGVTAPPQPGQLELKLHATLAAGGTASATLGTIDVVSPPEPAADSGLAGDDAIAICMATYNPDPELFRRQVESLREQTHGNWHCFISDDCSDPEAYAGIEEEIAGDERITASRSPERLGFYRNFERAMEMAPAGAAYVALCDQDDVWYPEKLTTLLGALRGEGAQLAYSDQRLTDPAGNVIAETLWDGRRNNWESLASMLVANTVTGAATLFRREVAAAALPFPDQPGWQFHDHWIALVALARGPLAYVDRPLYDYVQHPKAILGQVAVEEGDAEPGGRRLRRPHPRAALREMLGGGRAVYFCGYERLKVQAQTLLLRCSDELTASKRRALERFAEAESAPAGAAWLFLRPLRRFIGHSETLGSERQLLKGILWRRSIAVRARRDPHASRGPQDASMPPCGPDSFGQKRLRRWRARG